jgi:hypothetical protein
MIFSFFEFIPETRKFFTHYSGLHNLIGYLIQSLGIGAYLYAIDEITVLTWLVVLNLLFIIIYPTVFQYCYNKEKK